MMPILADQEFHAHLGAGRFMLPADAAGVPFYPPRATVPGTASTDVRWVEVSGLGTVYAATIVHKRPPEIAYNIALIDLAEGPRMMSRVEGIDLAAVRIGMAVKARIAMSDTGEPFVVFDPIGEARGAA